MIYVLDTNIISELMGGDQSGLLRPWLDRFPADKLCTTVITEAEIAAGIEVLPSGRRKVALAQAADHVFTTLFQDRVLTLDRESARMFGEIVSVRRKQGRPIATFDASIAAMARRHDATVVTRDENGFQEAGVAVLNPWNEG